MNKIKFIDAKGKPGVAVCTQKKATGHVWEWRPTPANVKARLLAMGCTLTGKRQKKVAA